jgi:hypothetical protein
MNAFSLEGGAWPCSVWLKRSRPKVDTLTNGQIALAPDHTGLTTQERTSLF